MRIVWCGLAIAFHVLFLGTLWAVDRQDPVGTRRGSIRASSKCCAKVALPCTATRQGHNVCV